MQSFIAQVGASNGGLCGYDAGERIKGRKRHMITDTLELMLFELVHSADIQNCDGAPDLFRAIRYRFPWLRHMFADGGYSGTKLHKALASQGNWTIEVIRRCDATEGFKGLSRRWIVERTVERFGRCRRLARDRETSIESSAAWICNASIRIMTRRLTTYCHYS